MKFNEYYLEVFMNWLVDNHLVVDYIEEFLRHKKRFFLMLEICVTMITIAL